MSQEFWKGYDAYVKQNYNVTCPANQPNSGYYSLTISQVSTCSKMVRSLEECMKSKTKPKECGAYLSAEEIAPLKSFGDMCSDTRVTSVSWYLRCREQAMGDGYDWWVMYGYPYPPFGYYPLDGLDTGIDGAPKFKTDGYMSSYCYNNYYVPSLN